MTKEELMNAIMGLPAETQANHKKPLARRTIDARSFFLTVIHAIGTFTDRTPFSTDLLLFRNSPA